MPAKRDDKLAAWRAAWSKPEPVPPWKWAAGAINYSLSGAYDTPYKGRFDPELLPFWKEPLELMHDRNTREIVILKASRTGFSENLILTDLRYTLANEPEPTLYITGTMDLALGFMERRVIRGMELAAETAKKYRHARRTKTDISFLDMDFRATWASSDTATKQDGWARIYCDEVSLWPEFTVDMVRRRAAAYPFHHIVYGGSLNPELKGKPDQDPIWKLWEESDRRHWWMPDPKTGKPFRLTFDGLRWPESCKVGDEWDLEAVEREAYYQTPDGTRIDEAGRMAAVRAGWWEAEQPSRARAGFRVVAAMMPFADCTFGQLAIRFLSAKHRLGDGTGDRKDRTRNTLRTYFAEYWAELSKEDTIEARDESLASLEADYEYGAVFCPSGWQHGVMFTVDVQKYHLWWLALAWSVNDKTAEVQASLLEYGTSASVQDCDAKAAEFSPSLIGVDIGYRLRASEIGEWCAAYTPANDPRRATAFALAGSDKLTATVLSYTVRDALEGKSAARRMPYVEYSWATEVFRSWAIDVLNGDGSFPFRVPATWPDPKKRREFARQVTSTKLVDGIAVPPSHGQDHLFDCLCMQLVLARLDNLIK
jgi:hypothetical protein